MDQANLTEADAETSETDRSILEMISQGAKNSEIADRTHYSLATIKVRVRRLMRDLGAKNRAELAAKASRLTMAEEEPPAQGLTDAEMVFLWRFPKLPPETRAIIAKVSLALSKALSENTEK